MPPRELGSSSLEPPNGAHGVGTTLLKRHKILPHPRDERPADFYAPSTPANKPRDLAIDTETLSMPSSDASSPRILKHASKRIGAPDLPPTPPTHSRQSSGSHNHIIAPPIFDTLSISNSTEARSAPSTPPNARSPPTPDVTPPRMPPLTHQNRHRPLLPSVPSSRNDSFKTAREDPCSSDEEASTVRPVLLSASTSAVEVPRAVQAIQKRKEVGLGLGLESDAGTTTSQPTQIDRSKEEFVVFDGEWGTDVNEVTREWDANLMRNVTVRKRPARQRLPIYTDGARDVVLEDDIVTPTAATRIVRSLPLQERIAKHRLPKDKVDRRPAADPYSWTPTMEESPTRPEIRRVSTISARSTNSRVEAMVVNPPPVRRKTLRHTKKQFALRDFSSDQSTISSAPTSVVSIEPVHRLHHASVRIPDRKHRSATSNATISTTSSSGRSRREILNGGGIPVVIIPDRRSSTRSSKPPSLRSMSSKRTKRSASLGSAPLSHSSKFNEPGYFYNAPVTRGRTLSESAGSVRTIDFPPNIPARRSSLSAPTSRNASRAPSIAGSREKSAPSMSGSRDGSLTTESLKAHNLLQAEKAEPSVQITPPAEVSRDASPEFHRLHVDHNGDPFFGNRLSTQVTPFSTVSYETAGTTAEVSEALAVSIFPHQNRSVLVVQHEPTPPTLKILTNSSSDRNTTSSERTVTRNPNSKISVAPVTPPQPSSQTMDDIDSPLRNPRAPPEPPAIKFIPPTPAGTEEDRQLGAPAPPSDAPPQRSMSLIRRFSSRRRASEPAGNQGGIRRFLSLASRPPNSSDGSTQTSKTEANPSGLGYPSVADKPADGTKLHPFWRPAHFWDDLENEEGHRIDGWPEIDNRPGLKRSGTWGKVKRSIGIEDGDDEDWRWEGRRDREERSPERRTMVKTPRGHLRVVKQRSSSSSLRRERLRSPSNSRRPHTDAGERQWGSNFREGNGGRRQHTIPGLGIKVQYVGWSGLKRRLSERRRERMKNGLRISGPVGLRGGVDDVLREGSGSGSGSRLRL